MYFNCSVRLSVCLFVHHCISFCLPLSPTVSQFACLTIGLSHSLPAWLSGLSHTEFACLTIRVYLTVCLPVSLSGLSHSLPA